MSARHLRLIDRWRGVVIDPMTQEEHCRMLEALRGCAAAVVLSGYRSALYDSVLGDWCSVDIAASTGQGSVWSERTETLWSNRDIGIGQHVMEFPA